MPAPQTILITGAGLAGPLLALSLLRTPTPPTIHLYESHAEPTTLGGAINLTPNGARILSSLGLSAPGCPVRALEFFSAHSGARIGSVAFGGVETYGFDSVRVGRAALQQLLLDAVEAAGGTVTWGKTVVGVRDDDDNNNNNNNNSVTAVFADGSESPRADILVGADGVHSAVRRAYVDPECKPLYAGIATAYGFCDVRDEDDDDEEEEEEEKKKKMHFEASSLNVARKGSLLLSFCDKEKTRVFWALAVAVAREKVPQRSGAKGAGWRAADQQATKREVVARLEECGFLGERFRDMVDRTQEVCFYPINELPPGGRWWRGRCVLIGDAAHAMPPQGQSIGLAFEDAILLKRVLTEMAQEKTLAERFSRWEELRRPRIMKAHHEASKMREGVSEVSWFWHWCREWIYWFFLAVFRKHSSEQFAYDVSKQVL